MATMIVKYVFLLSAVLNLVQGEDFCDPFYGLCSDPSLEPERDTSAEVCDPFIFDCDGSESESNKGETDTVCDPFTENCPDGTETGIECDPKIEKCDDNSSGFIAKEKYEIINMILIFFNLILQVLALLVPVLFGADSVDMQIAFNVSIYGYAPISFICLGYMVSTGFTEERWLKDVAIITVQHVLSNFMPIAIIVTTLYAFIAASEQDGAGTVWTGGVIYFILAGLINYLLMGWSYGAIKYVDKNWNELPGPYILPSWLHLLGVGTWDDGEREQAEAQ